MRLGQPGATTGQDHRADGGDQQQQRRDLERQQEPRQEQLADLGRRAEPRFIRRAVGLERRQRRADERDRQLDEQGEREDDRRKPQGRAGRRGRRLAGTADVGDHEHVQHHHRARVHDDLGRGDELGSEQQEQRRQREQVADQRKHRVERVAERDGAHGAGHGADRRHEEDDLRHERGVMLRGSAYEGSPHFGIDESPPRAIAISVSLDRRLVSYGGIFHGCRAIVP